MTKPGKPKYSRILLKLSGEALGGESGVGICPKSIHDMARQVGEVRQLGVEIVIVVGGGNMAEALIKGLLAARVLVPERIWGSDPRRARCDELVRERVPGPEGGSTPRVGLREGWPLQSPGESWRPLLTSLREGRGSLVARAAPTR